MIGTRGQNIGNWGGVGGGGGSGGGGGNSGETTNLSGKQSSSNRTNNLGLISLNQMELKHELKRIELCRRQYELSFEHEQRKLITRIANKLIHSNSNLDVLFKSHKRPTNHHHHHIF